MKAKKPCIIFFFFKNELIDKQLLIQIKKAYDVVSKMKNNAKQNEMLAMLTDYNLNRSK